MSKNVGVVMDGDILTITVDVKKDFGKSKSGKNTIVASTEGAIKIGEVSVNLNVYK